LQTRLVVFIDGKLGGSRKAAVGRWAERLFGAEERSALQVAPSA
jgi:hypothetical protein